MRKPTEQQPDDAAALGWALLPLAAALVAAFIALIGNHRLQTRSGRRIRDADELKRRLYDFLALVAEYWMGEERDLALEAKVLATKLIVLAELQQMGQHSMPLLRWYRDTEDCRLAMIDAATGGCFQQRNWKSDPSRVMVMARELGRIIRKLREAC